MSADYNVKDSHQHNPLQRALLLADSLIEHLRRQGVEVDGHDAHTSAFTPAAHTGCLYVVFLAIEDEVHFTAEVKEVESSNPKRYTVNVERHYPPLLIEELPA